MVLYPSLPLSWSSDLSSSAHGTTRTPRWPLPNRSLRPIKPTGTGWHVAAGANHGLHLCSTWEFITRSGAPANEGIARLREGLATYDRTGTEMDRPYFLGLMADGYAASGEVQEALAPLGEALQSVSGGRPFFYEAELHRLRGTLLQRTGLRQDMGKAEASFERALEIARLQQARSLELRTALCLGDLRRAQGDERGLEMARSMLQETYGWFTEGFETPDLEEARNRLEATGS